MPYALLTSTFERLTDAALRDRHHAVAMASLAWLAIAIADWLTIYRVESQPAVLRRHVPRQLAYSGWRAGLVFAVLSLVNQVAIGTVLGHPYSRPSYFIVTNFNKLFSACLLIALVARLRLMHERERTHARVDYLTGALNNMGFFEALSVELSRHRAKLRRSQSRTSIATTSSR